MPDYDYVCSKCGRAFAVFFSFKELEAKPYVRSIFNSSWKIIQE